MRVELEREGARHHAGERLVGAVVLAPDERDGLERVEVSVGWRTHGKGNSDAGRPIVVRLDERSLDEAGEARLPFAVELPSGPVSYAGEVVSVEWAAPPSTRAVDGGRRDGEASAR